MFKFNNINVIGGGGNFIDLARVIGIGCVIYGHCHPFLGEIDVASRFIVYTFHMPLFFIVSGMLEREKNEHILLFIKKIAYCLLLPYLIYNIPYFVGILNNPKGILTGFFTSNTPPNDPTWFFYALFFVKLITKAFERWRLQLLTTCLLLYLLLEFTGVSIGSYLCAHAIITGTIFYELGHYLNRWLGKKSLLYIFPAAIFCCALSTAQIERYDMFLGYCGNPILYITTSFCVATVILLLCRYLACIVPQRFMDKLLPISRGTMLIVGTHYIIAHFANKLLFDSYPLLSVKIIYTIALLLVYWILISLTYNKFKFLYGKK